MSLCRRFLEGVAEGPAPDARIYDDRDASISIVSSPGFETGRYGSVSRAKPYDGGASKSKKPTSKKAMSKP